MNARLKLHLIEYLTNGFYLVEQFYIFTILLNFHEIIKLEKTKKLLL